MSNVPSGWEWRDASYGWPRWQLNAKDGMMLAIIYRPYLEVLGRVIDIPVGWRWRNSWAGGDGGWVLARSTAVAKAEQGAGCG